MAVLLCVQTYNYAEFYQRAVVLLWGWIMEQGGGSRATRPVPRNVTIVLAPALNLPLQPYHKLLLQPFSDLQVNGCQVWQVAVCILQASPTAVPHAHAAACYSRFKGGQVGGLHLALCFRV